MRSQQEGRATTLAVHYCSAMSRRRLESTSQLGSPLGLHGYSETGRTDIPEKRLPMLQSTNPEWKRTISAKSE